MRITKFLVKLFKMFLNICNIDNVPRYLGYRGYQLFPTLAILHKFQGGGGGGQKSLNRKIPINFVTPQKHKLSIVYYSKINFFRFLLLFSLLKSCLKNAPLLENGSTKFEYAKLLVWTKCIFLLVSMFYPGTHWVPFTKLSKIKQPLVWSCHCCKPHFMNFCSFKEISSKECHLWTPSSRNIRKWFVTKHEYC